MTVPYRNEFIIRTLIRWNGSVWKAIWKDILFFIAIYYVLNIPLRLLLTDTQKEMFEPIRGFFRAEVNNNCSLIFILSFFVSTTMCRLWNQFDLAIATPSRFASLVAINVRPDKGGKLEEVQANKIRRCMVRWTFVMVVLSFRRHSIRVRKRFPDFDHLQKCGLLTVEERSMLEETRISNKFGMWWQPSMWILNLLRRCYKEQCIAAPVYNRLCDEVLNYRDKLDNLMNYHWVKIPLPYTQLVSVSLFFYFLCDAVAYQMIPGTGIDMYVPVFMIVRFGLFVGLFRIGEDILDPFGEDEDDFEMNWILDRSINACFLQADRLSDQLPSITSDKYEGMWQINLPHTKASARIRSYAYAEDDAMSKINRLKNSNDQVDATNDGAVPDAAKTDAVFTGEFAVKL